MSLLEPTRVDDRHVRADRRHRLLAAMAAEDLDALVLGRPAEVAFATGARQLWTAGTRPFGPTGVAVRSTGRVHLLSVSDFDVPEEVGHEDLYGLSWDPRHVVDALAAVPGLADARRIGTSSSSPGLSRLLVAVAPRAQVVDGNPALWAARGPKSTDEVDRILAATSVAEVGLAAMVASLRPGISERALLATYLEAIASVGAPVPPTEGVVCATATDGPVTLRRLATAAEVTEGQLVVLDPGGFHRGYEGGVGRTWVAGTATAAHRHLADRCRSALDALVDACRPGATGADLLAAWRATGEPVPAGPLAHGLGMGVEPPVVGDGVGATTVLSERTVLSLTSWVSETGVGGFLERDLVLVTAGSPEVLTSHGRGPAGGGT